MQGFCRGCLNKYNDPTDLLQYCESNRRLFVYCTGLQVKRNDAFPFQLCKECYLNMKLSCKFKKQCRNSDRTLKNYLALKKEGDCVDFSTFLKNAEDSLAFRLPIVSRSSTPSHQITEDDDNASTCTSIQNFMTDMLQGEEMPPAEARIIREVIQEEADILDDSLDSHWLQDDLSVDNDFAMDFNFSAFSPPRSINNDHCYTPRRITDNNREPNYYMPKERTERAFEIQVPRKYDMPILDDVGDSIVESDLEIGLDTESIKEPDKQFRNIVHQTDMPLLDDYDMEFNGVVGSDITIELSTGRIESVKESDKDIIETREKSQDSDVFLQSKIAEITAVDNPFAKFESFSDALFSDKNDLSPFANSDNVAVINKTIESEMAHKNNEKEFSIILNKGIAAKKVGYEEDIIAKSPLTHELEQYIKKAKYKKTIESIEMKTDSCTKVQKNLNGGTNITSKVQQIEKAFCTDLNHEKVVEKVGSPLKHELDHYINISKLKKKTSLKYEVNKTKKNYIKGEKCSIDRNLEIALKSNEDQKFSLDQLLLSPQVSIRSGASTPTINKILFGAMTPKDTRFDEVPDSKDIDPTGVIEEFLKDSYYNGQSTPKKEFIEVKGRKRGFKDINKLEELKKSISRKNKRKKLTRGLKDIKKLKELMKFDHEQNSKFSDDRQSCSPNSKTISVVEKEIDAKPILHSESEIKSNILQSNEEGGKVKTTLQSGEIDDLDISISSLINFDDNQSVDLNISISSDFLKEDKHHNNDTVQNDVHDPFKRPFSPIDSKYDLDKCLCKICDKTYTSIPSLKSHFKRFHNIKMPRKKTVPRPIVCYACGKGFKSASNLTRHIKSQHQASENFQCDHCTLTFSTKGKLILHMRAHTNEITKNKSTGIENNMDKNIKKKFICSTCGKTFETLGNFNLHKRRHTKSYTVSCMFCQKGFYRTQDLKLHMSKHDGVYSFACQYCPKVYRRRDLLLGHIYRHMDKTKYACEFCNKQFVTKQILRTHYTSQTCVKSRKVPNEVQETAVDVTYTVGATEKIVDTLKSKKRLKLNNDKDLAEKDDSLNDSKVDSAKKSVEVEETEKT